MTRARDPVDQVLRRIYGKPCWNVKEGYASTLTFEFGKPRLEIMEPRRVRRNTSPRVRKLFSRRQVFVRGDWHLWIFGCRWTIFQDGKRLASNSSKFDKTWFAVRELQGQALVRVSIDAKRGRSTFEFDYGGRLETRRHDRTLAQWILHDPRKHVLQIRGDGKYSYDHESTSCNETEWKPRPSHWRIL